VNVPRTARPLAAEIDYIKIDGCQGAQDAQTSWTLFHRGLEECYNRTGRQIVMSVESCDSPTTGCGLFVADLANLWRTGDDIQNTWASVMTNIHANDIMASVAKPGHFNDPDMLNVGNVGLTLEEQRSHFSLWAIAGAPLLAGNDVVHASNETLAILTAREVIAVNQDLGINGAIQGRLLTTGGSEHEHAADGVPAALSAPEVWAKPLSDGKRIAVVLLNTDPSGTQDVTVTWQQLGLPASTNASVRDLWQQKDVGTAQQQFIAKAVPPHGVVMVTVAAP
jgi:alpha-galactosidase